MTEKKPVKSKYVLRLCLDFGQLVKFEKKTDALSLSLSLFQFQWE